MATNYFLVFSDDFGGHPSSCQHLFRHVPANTQVLWVNTIGMRNPKFSLRDIRKTLEKIYRMIVKRQTAEWQSPATDSHVTVLQPPMLPFQNIPGVRAINRRIVIPIIRKALHINGMQSPICVVTAPNACDFAGQFGESKIIYYCVDNFSEWPGMNKQLVLAMEDLLIAKADIFFATSYALKERLEGKGKKTYLLSHGVDITHFASTDVPEHQVLACIPKPRVGYFGLFDERSDQTLLAEVARRMPSVSFVVIGEVAVDISALKGIENFYFIDKVPFDELPGITTGLDVCMLPYVKSPLTDAINPLKLKEYLATGKLVVSTSIREANAMKEFILVADSAQAWQESIESGFLGLSKEELARREEMLRSETWYHKAKLFYCTVCKVDPESK